MPPPATRPADPRIATTRAAIRRALFQIAADLPFTEITVAYVCREAGVARKTFYAHYADVAAVADEAMCEALRPIVESIPDALLVLPLTTTGVARFVFAQVVVRGDLADMIARLPSDVAARGFAPAIDALFERIVAVNELHKIDAFVRDYWTAMVAAAAEALFRTWAARGFRETPEELAALSEQLVGSGVDAFLSRLARTRRSPGPVPAKHTRSRR